jgi:molybdopterin molybdotransferase
MFTDIDLETAIDLARRGQARLDVEDVAIHDANGRVLAGDVFASMDQPAFPRSPLDGYALIAADAGEASAEAPATLRVVGKVYAGDPARKRVGRGECVRLMTGAIIPESCDCVVRQEDTDRGEETVRIYQPMKKWRNYCFKGEDYKSGALLLPDAARIGPAAAAILASAGLTTARVVRKPVVSILSTGSELIEPGEPYAEGKVYASSVFYIAARLQELGAFVSERRIARDDEKEIGDCLRELAARSDLVITTGGVSVGEKDLLPGTLEKAGAELVFHWIRMKPGSPALFSILDGTRVLSLSGNPFAAITSFELLVWRVLARMTGDDTLIPGEGKGELRSSFHKKSDSRRFLRGYFDGRFVTLPAAHDNGQIHSLIGCNCLVDIPAGSGRLEEGDEAKVVILPR